MRHDIKNQKGGEMINVKLKKDEVKIIHYALELAYSCCDGSPVLKPCHYDHPDYEKRCEEDWDVACDVIDKIRGWKK